MANIDLKKVYRDHYTADALPGFVEVPPRPYLMIDGEGDPNTAVAYRQAVEALYPLAYGLRAAIRQRTGEAYVVMPLEGLWWVPAAKQFRFDDRSDWQWTAMICLPDVVTVALAAEVLPAVTAKKRLAAGSKARVEQFGDGPAAQVLHIGPYADEAPTIAKLHQFIVEQGHELAGIHHEIYLSDPARTDPTAVRTIIRQPIAAA